MIDTLQMFLGGDDDVGSAGSASNSEPGRADTAAATSTSFAAAFHGHV